MKILKISLYLFLLLNLVSLILGLDKTEAIGDLTAIKDTMKWTKLQDCRKTFSSTIDAVKKLDEKIKVHPDIFNGSNEYDRFLLEVMHIKFIWLLEEASYLLSRCTALDYDGYGFSLEREFRLYFFFMEWETTIEWMRDSIESENYAYLYKDIKVSNQLTPPSNKSITKPLFQFRDCQQDYCPEMVVIPKGSFLMGGNEVEEQEYQIPYLQATWESPRHAVYMKKPFAMSSKEVTLSAYREFVKETNYSMPQGCTTLKTEPGHGTQQFFNREKNFQNCDFIQDPQEPVLCVRTEDAREYAKWLSKKTNQNYRLPSETEWEYCARAGTNTTFFWGNNRDEACLYANVNDLTTKSIANYTFSYFNCSDKAVYTSKVGSYKPNAFKMYDMTGNAREWVSDCWHPNYQGAPKNSSVWGRENEGLCHFGILRGGAWAYNIIHMRISYRNAYLSSQTRCNMWGFRLVREI
ncbi:hypothetical protein CYY_000694 [Polysphondylium violaceum]|uniref:Sulfatase-modifying factor enzyme-like domain-containing protein n=1 Tax=Polysphondylium violaceum TaxID=133409 RepID=A0A8J4V263_9MYCE|nr:hypothetical protein CYY_000694 [Polysphondylium violaceum]